MIDLEKLGLDSSISPLIEGADAIIASNLADQSRDGVIFVARDDKRMAAIAKNIRYFSPTTKIIQIPAWDCLPYDRVSPSMHVTNLRTESLCEVATLKNRHGLIIVTTVNALLQRVPPAKKLTELTFKAHEGDEVNRKELIDHLVKSGYIHSATANEAGEFAVRGSIIDIISSDSEKGLRLDFFDDKLEVIRLFDPLTQISAGKRKTVSLMPTSEVVMDEESIEKFRNNYRRLFGAIQASDPLYEAISEGRNYAGMEHWLPLFYDKLDSLFDYLPNCPLIFDHLAIEAHNERLEIIIDYYKSREESTNSGFSSSGSYKAIPPKMLYLDEEEWEQNLSGRKIIKTSIFKLPDSDGAIELAYKSVPNFSTEAKTTKTNAFDLLSKFLFEKRAQRKIITCHSEGSRERMRKMLCEHDIHVVIIDKFEQAKKVKAKTIGLTILALESGFESDEYVVISEQDIVGERLNAGRKLKRKSENFLTEAASLSEGELVVHNEHGLGRFETLETLVISGENHDCLRIIYHGGDKLYVPVENIEILSRYGSEKETDQLDKLGSASWQARKSKIKKRIKNIAEGLIKIAAERELKTAPELEAMAGLYEEFCSRFPYAETEDQLRCIEDVAKDLMSGRPMDRLICGDVGFGKTEIALRASFIAASCNEHKQVAIICPTTLLCRQHYQTFKKRFAEFPFEVRDLSRLTPPKNVKETKKYIENGRADIVIGTHALLAKSIKFKNLGLVIIDEEQLFGVVQKERFKQLRSGIHILSLSATPIPRTLQMSLSGIKDLSIIATPPIDRLAIRSFSMPFDPVIIRNAILREHYRGGHTFFVVPKIKDLDEIESKLKALIPEVKMVRAHGQMPPVQLDQTMSDFYDGKYDVLLSTNIIGSGIDLPTANTIIIHRADMFGLSQLYQMRGRVGRGKIRAYAYFTTPPKRVPSKTAIKRLEVIQSLDSLGAGFNLASHDMDIRGAGNLVGDEQSGHIKEVGIELYQQMLKDAIEKAKLSGQNEGDADEKWSPHINLGIPVLIPEKYVANLDLRLGLYRRIADLKTEDDLEAIAVELIDRFGKLPEEVLNLLDIMKIKQLCIQAGVEKIDAGPKGIMLTFYRNKFKNTEALLQYIMTNPLKTKIRGDQKLVLMNDWKGAKERLEGTKKSLNKIAELAV